MSFVKNKGALKAQEGVAQVQDVGLGLCNLRFLTNAAVAGCDRIPGRTEHQTTRDLLKGHNRISCLTLLLRGAPPCWPW